MPRFLDAALAAYRYRAHAAHRDIEHNHRLVRRRLIRRGLVLGNVLGDMLGGASAFSALVSGIWHLAR